MEWLDFNTAYELGHALPEGTLIQILILQANLSRLRDEIPRPPDLVPASDGPPAPMHRWYGRVGERTFSLECVEFDFGPCSTVMIETPYLAGQDRQGDWSVLKDLAQLPTSALATRPIYVECRDREPLSVVYRPSAKGWNEVIYEASTQSEGRQMLQFLQTDPYNDECFVGPPEPKGNWYAHTSDCDLGSNRESVLHHVLRSASEQSIRYAPKTYFVRDGSGKSPRVFQVKNGHVTEINGGERNE